MSTLVVFDIAFSPIVHTKTIETHTLENAQAVQSGDIRKRSPFVSVWTTKMEAFEIADITPIQYS